jgi:hypothetical protein
MIDFENQVFDTIAKPLYDQFGENGIFITGEPVRTVQELFPAVSIIQTDNSVLMKTRSMENIENHANVMYEIDVYSNLTQGRKRQAKEIAAIISDVFTEHNFTRTFCQPLDNLADSKIYRIKMRFKAVIGKDGWIYTT